MGYGHSIENIGTDGCKLLIVFNHGVYEKISLRLVLATNPDELISANLNLPLETVRSYSGKQTFIIGGDKK